MVQILLLSLRQTGKRRLIVIALLSHAARGSGCSRGELFII